MHTCTRTHIGAASTRRNESRYIQSGRSNANSCEGYPIVFILEVVRDERGKTDTTKTRASSRSFSFEQPTNDLVRGLFSSSRLAIRHNPPFLEDVRNFGRCYVDWLDQKIVLMPIFFLPTQRRDRNTIRRRLDVLAPFAHGAARNP